MTPLEMVREFHEAFGIPIRTVPTYPPPDEALLRGRLMHEEQRELAEAWYDSEAVRRHTPHQMPTHLAEVARELADVVIVACGTALACGIDLDAVIAEVHAANMRKLGPDGKPVMRADGKVLKPDGWEPADVLGAMLGGTA